MLGGQVFYCMFHAVMLANCASFASVSVVEWMAQEVEQMAQEVEQMAQLPPILPASAYVWKPHFS